LDTKIVINDHKITFDLYKKPTSSGRYLNLYSHHPMAHKRGIIFGMVDKIILLSHPRFHKNLIGSVKILLNNGYLLPFIFNTIRSRITLHSKKEFLTIFNTDIDNNLELTSKKEFFTIPYIKSISESFVPVTKKYGFDIAYSIPNTLSSFIKCGKDNLDLISCHGVVYKISCHDCDASYIGQTKRQLRTRIKEYNSDIRKKNGLHLKLLSID